MVKNNEKMVYSSATLSSYRECPLQYAMKHQKYIDKTNIVSMKKFNNSDDYLPLNYNALVNYKTCPLKFSLDYNKRGKTSSRKAELIRGDIVHDWIGQFISNGFLYPGFSCQGLDGEKEAALIDFISQTLKRDNVHFNIEKDFAVCHDFLPCIWDSAYGFFRGRIDLFWLDTYSNTFHVLDWKTGKSPGETWQLECYKWLLSKVFNDMCCEATHGYFYMIDKKKIIEVPLRPLAEIEQEIIYLHNNILSDTEDGFAPVLSYRCRFCKYSSECPIDPLKVTRLKSNLTSLRKNITVLLSDGHAK